MLENELTEKKCLLEKIESSFDQKMEMAAAEQNRLLRLDHERQRKTDHDFA